ncbi:MAG: hypothetical protein D6744_08135 [Planctomycetota bacterium]|nr:MAG: hypothetical protein D6744_08135 [Planctomycetota bacterium]
MPLHLHDLYERLDGYSRQVPLDDLTTWLRDLEIDPADLMEYARFDPHGYQRNLLRAGPGYHALLLCWLPGQRSPIHDHRGSSCGVRVIQGTLTETVFDRTPHGHIYPTHTGELSVGAVCGSVDADIHQISNLHPTENLITLHVYTPPLVRMGTYSLMHTRVEQFCDPVVTFSQGAGI